MMGRGPSFLGALVLLLGGCQSAEDLRARPPEFGFHIAAPYRTVKLNIESTMYECFDVWVSPLVHYIVESKETVPGAATTISYGSTAVTSEAVDVRAAGDGTDVYYYETKYALFSRDEAVVRGWALGTGRCDGNRAASPVKSKKITALPQTTAITPL